ncbi:Amidase [Fragilaria crotonensis]|nr:Amidase [Fragilaria crotonensis]
MTRTSRLTVSLAQHLIASGRITKQELVTYCHSLAVAGEERWGLNAFTHLNSKEFILEQVDKSEGPLAGIPISIKANLAVREMPLTASSRMLATGVSCGYDADVVRILRSAGAIVIGTTQMDEFGMGSLGTNLGEGTSNFTKNPIPLMTISERSYDQWQQEIKKSHDAILEDHMVATDEMDIWYAGGSSCGSAASVAHGSSIVSLASDTGGSIRLPAAWCGISGFKPSIGRLSRKGLVSYASSLDTIGCLAPTAECMAIIMHQMELDKQESVTDSTVSHAHQTVTNDRKSLLVGIPSAFSVDGCPKEILDAWADAARYLQQNGATLVEIPSSVISSDMIRASLATYYIIASAEASSNLSRYDGLRYGLSDQRGSTHTTLDDLSVLESKYATTRSVGFGQEVLRRILSGTSVLSSDRFHTHYEAASTIRAQVSKQMRQALDTVDVLLTPTCLSFPNSTDLDPTGMFANDVFTVPVSLACLPAISIPWSRDVHKPVGLQIVGSSDEKVLEVAAELQRSVASTEDCR